ncbi:MAG: DUF4214 domain-containing protein [Rhizobiaceae bacterium]|nr:DUF4214 domain-containing protein [Rhizobiaceae bacterium]
MPTVDNYTAILSGRTLNQQSTSEGTALPARAAFVTYSFNALDSGDPDTQITLDDTQKELFRRAIDQWAQASGLTAFETAMQGDIDVVVRNLTFAGQGTFPQSMVYLDDGAPRVYSGTAAVGTILIDPDYASDAHVLIHEIGHTLGLKHPHDGLVRLVTAADTGDNTVMSYTVPLLDDLGTFDIQAIQAIYGGPSADGTQVSAWNWDQKTETLTQIGSAETEILIGTNANDIIDTAGGQDAVSTKGGDDVVTVRANGVQANLGTGFDTVIVDYSRDQIAFIDSDDAGTYFYAASGNQDDTSVFFGVERFDFGDETLAMDLDGNAGQAYRLYQAAYDREPDRAGVSFWTGVLDAGNGLQFVADHFVTAAEFIERYGADTSDTDYVDLLYNNVLDRVPDQEGYDFWVGKMDAGLTRADMLIEFSESDENQAKVFGDIDQGIWLDDLLLG